MGPWLLALLGTLPSENGGIARAEYSLTCDLAYDQALGRLPETLPTSGGSADLLARVTVFLDGVRDDATPIALQPFLQRGSSLSLTADAGWVDAPDSIATALLGDLAAPSRRIRFSVAGELYLARWAALTLSSGYRFDAISPTSGSSGGSGAKLHGDTIPWSAGLAFRAGDLRIALGIDGFYRATEASGSRFTDETHLRFAGDLRGVLVNHIDLGVTGSAWDHGADAALHVDYYPSRRLGLLTRAYGGRSSAQPFPDGGTLGEFAGHSPIAAPGSHLGVLVGASFWPSPSLGVSAHYGAAWIEGLTAGATDQRIILSVAGRSFF